jgi:serine phosphatase RsbU (regulator of sigma subunit)
MSGCYNNLGNVYFEIDEYDKCIYYYKKSLDLRYQIGDKEGQSSVLGNIAALNLKLKQYEEAINNAKKSNLIAKEIGVIPWQSSAVAILSATYDSLGNYKNAYEYQKLYKSLNDSMFSIESSRQIKGMEAKYESEKKRKEIELLNKDRQLQDTEIKQQIIIKYAFIFGFILMGLLVIVVYRNYRNKQMANVILSQQKEEILTQRDEIVAQRDLVTEQKEHIEKIHKDVTDSINYAKRIQEAVLPVSETARSVLGEHFILFKPKNIVSGDFYWTTKINNLLFVAVADCTGHGVPGAFMSMLGISFLNEIAQKQEIIKANQILNNLRKEIINALQQKGVQGEQKYGMDISLLVVNTETNECQWAGANNPLYIVPSVIPNESEESSLNINIAAHENCSFQAQNDNRELIELKGDKMPIAIYPTMNDFTNHEFILHKGDSVYLFTDGYADQFGGNNGRKFMCKQFKEILINNMHKSMPEQKVILDETFENWKGVYDQIDDVTVLGIRI